MNKRINICNACGKRTDDYYAEIGWIRIAEYGLSISNGRKRDGSANTERWYSDIISPDGGLDFCCWVCLLNWLYANPNTDNKHGEKPKEDVSAFMDKMGLPDVAR